MMFGFGFVWSAMQYAHHYGTERDVLNVKKGQPVRVRADVFPDLNIPGKVTNIGLRADNAFTYDIEIEVINPKGNPLRGGMHAKSVFTFDANRQGLTLPRKVIAGSLQDPKIYVVQGDSIATLRAITLGGMFGDRVEVISGIRDGEKVVLSGQLNLVDGARVSVVR